MNENYRPIMSSPTRRHWRVASLPLLVILLATLVLLAPAGSRAEVGAPLAQSSQYLPVVFKLSRQ
jgi:hypothetical protein